MISPGIRFHLGFAWRLARERVESMDKMSLVMLQVAAMGGLIALCILFYVLGLI